MENFTERTAPAGLYDSRFEHDNCGIGAVVDIKGRKSHRTLDDALQIVEHLEHRAGKDAEGKTQLCHTLNNTVVAPPRMLIAFLENNLCADGSVRIPEVLRPYMGGKAVLTPKH